LAALLHALISFETFEGLAPTKCFEEVAPRLKRLVRAALQALSSSGSEKEDD
jgi:hypothetical protein